MSKPVGVRHAKTHLSRLLEDVVAVARRPIRARQFGLDVGRWTVPGDFDAPLPDELLTSFEQ